MCTPQRFVHLFLNLPFPPLKTIEKILNVSAGTVNKITKYDLKLIKATTTTKNDAYRLTMKHISEHRVMCRFLYENYLAGEKSKSIADEAWIYVSG